MKKAIAVLILLFFYDSSVAQKTSTGGPTHFVCIQTPNTYHDREHCAGLQVCSGGKIRKTKNVDGLQPCRKCAKPALQYADFADIKRILGVKDKKQIVDSIGTDESLIKRPEGFTIRISGPPESRTVDNLEFFITTPMVFNEDSLLSSQFFNQLGLEFGACRSDTIRSTAPHPVTGKVKKDFTIEYRACAQVEARDRYEDTSKYYYELTFFAKEVEQSALLDKIQLLLKVERP
ncbi:MAG: hypothetical protein WKF87_02385 [Chryseolinea sp.]